MKKPMSLLDRLLFAGLIFAGGGFDAYTYLVHDGVFAGMQTGNLIILGTNLGQMKWDAIVNHLIPIFAFMIGIIVTRNLQHRFKEEDSINKRQRFVIGIETILLIIVAVIPKSWPTQLSTGIVSMVAAAQLQEFRQINGGPFTSFMMTGNLRTMAESFYDGIVKNNVIAMAKGWRMLGVVLAFLFGAVSMGAMVPIMGTKTILLAAFFLLCSLIGLQLNPDKRL
ncbi:YoaK family protein [Dellaglioa sp. BT-FLS60]